MIELLADEKIILQKRRHWYAIASESSTLFFAGIVPLLIFLWLILGSASPVVEAFLPLMIAILSGWFLLLWVIFFIFWTNYYLDVLVITNKRVIDIEQHGLFARDVVEIPIRNIQDTKVEVFGFIATFLDFGNIHIQTAGESREVVIHNIADPYQIRQEISRRHYEFNNPK